MYSVLGILLYYFRFRFIQFWSLTKINNYQSKKIKVLLKSISTIDSLQIDFNLDGAEFLDEYKKKIPITTKLKVKQNPDTFLTRKPTLLDLKFYTSGSTGEPMKAHISWRHWIVEQAVIYRHWKWHGYKFRDTCAMLRSYAPKEGESIIKYSWKLNTFYYSPFHLDEEHMDEYFHHMISKNVKYLRGYPSSIKIFAEFCKSKNYSIPSLKFILTASEVLSEDDRTYIEDVFGVMIGNHYGLAEQIVMFGNCSESTILHNYNEYGFCELIPTDKENIYRIIGTNLHNDLMPLFRYDTGDLAYVRPDVNCLCGREGVQVERVIGRHDQLLIDSNGLKIPTVNFYTLMENFTELSGWQFIQNNDSLIMLCVANQMPEIQKNKIKNEILIGVNNRLSNSQFIFKVQFVNSLIKIKEGKIPTIIKNVKI